MAHVVLTGASRGIGVAIAEALGRRGDRVVLAARGDLGATVDAVHAAGGEAVAVPCDVAVAADRERLVAAAIADGPVDAVIHNAGVEVPIAFADQSPEQIERQLAVNLHAPLALTRLFLPHLLARRRGAICAVSSMSGRSPTPWNSVYTASKYGLNGFFAALRIELEGTGVHAGVVCPSFVADAGMWAATGVKAPRLVAEVPLADVVAAVLAVLDGAPEVLVTTPLARPMLALNQLFPSLDRRLLGWLGVLDVLKARAATDVHR